MLTHSIPLWIKLACSCYVAVLVPIYWIKYGPANFLWFSDVALFGMTAALWLESSLLASMMGLAVLFLELFWNLGFFSRLIFGINISSLSAYMFDSGRPLYLRLLSLFHVFMPPLIFWMVYRLGYDRRALVAQTILAWIVLAISYAATSPEENVNWVLGPGNGPQHSVPPLAYLGLMMLALPVIVYLPTHLVLMKLMSKPLP